MIIITNLCIGITFLFSIILIIDELYNVGFFTFNYTYLYNYGTFMSKFNNIQTIECETNRFNVYNNINFLFKDNYNKSYFNYLITIVLILITILCSIGYGVYFYYKFIIEQPDVCSFDGETNLSLPKQILKCLCDECHKIIPNCTGNYFIVFFIIIIIPLSYILKIFLKFDITPNSDNYLFNFIYTCIFILLLFYYSYNLFNRKTDDKYKDLIIYFFFTIIFILSGYIFKYIYSKYNNINLNTSNDNTTMYDIYKQKPPIKPIPIQKPTYKGKDLLSIFKYNDKDNDPEYKIKKSIVDNYYKSIKNYDIDMKHYNVRYNAYTSSLTSNKLGDKTDYLDIAVNILGLNNYMHLFIITFVIISFIIYNIYKDDVSYVCFIYLLAILITITIMNSILYYNTYLNKYIIYEPLAHYKNDITNANTALNLELDASSGISFYNKLVNNSKLSTNNINSDAKSGKEIFEDIKQLTDIKKYTLENISNITKNIINFNQNGKDLYYSDESMTKIDNVIFLYKKKTGEFSNTENSINYLIDNCIDSINTSSKNNIKIESYKTLILNFNSNNISLKLNMYGYYKFVYYRAYQYFQILNKLNTFSYIKNTFYFEITKLIDDLNDIKISLNKYKDTELIDVSLTASINDNIVRLLHSNTNINKNTYDDIKNKIETFKTNYITNKININILKTSYSSIGKIRAFNLDNNLIIEDTQYNIKLSDNSDYNYSSINYKYTISPNDNNLKQTINNITDIKYNELPNKITDINNDEYYFTLKPPIIDVYVKYKIININNINNYKLITQYTTISPLTNNSYDSIYELSKFDLNDMETKYSIPFNLYIYKINDIDKFKKIILSTLLNNICNIQTSFSNILLESKIERPLITVAIPNSKPSGFITSYEKQGQIKIFKYHDLFNEPFFNNIDYINIESSPTNLITINSNNNIISYVILLYNSYKASTVDIKKDISNNINYLINNHDLLFNNTNTTIISYLDTIIINKLLLNINLNKKSKNNDDNLIKMYNNNLYIINIIVQLYENLLSSIKKDISTNQTSLCLPDKTSLSTIENTINSIFTTTLTDPPTGSPVNTPKIVSCTGTAANYNAQLITNINNHIIYFYNMVIFLLNNIKSHNNKSDIDIITTNFNFYNRDDNIKELVRKQLIINCDYNSKYNNLDTKQLSYFKINAENVSYNFPILMIIFLIVLGEPAFIKS